MVMNNNTDNSRAVIYDENANTTPHDDQNIFTDEKPIALKQIKPNSEDNGCQTDAFVEELENKLMLMQVQLSQANAKMEEN